MRHLLLDFDAPLMSFGGDLVDAYGVVRDFPAKSMIAGLLANALGWERFEADRHARLQERLAVGSARVAEGRRVRDFQTALLGGGDRGWTTRGRFEGRAGGAGTYQSPHIRYRDADANARVLVALRLDDDAEPPSLDDVAAALDRPERPLFVGRKPFLPSRPLLLGEADAASIPEALVEGLARLAERDHPPERLDAVRAQWPLRESVGDDVLARQDDGRAMPVQEEELTDERHWPAGVHAGLRRVIEGRLAWPPPAPAPHAATEPAA